MKIKFGASKDRAKTSGPSVKPRVRKAMGELMGIEKAEKIQARIVKKKKEITERARAKKDETLIKRAEYGEQAAITVLDRIRADKKRVEAELAGVTATSEQQKDPAISDGSAPVEVTSPPLSLSRNAEAGVELVPAQEQTEGEEEEGVYIERYPVIEPYAYVTITATVPHIYKVSEVRLTKGEAELLKGIKSRLYETIDVSYSGVVDTEQLLRDKVNAIIDEFAVGQVLTPDSLNKILYYVKRDFMGFGKLDPVLHDKMAEDISADGPGIPVFVYHRAYHSIETNIIFDEDELDSLIYKMAQRSGRHISLAKPLLDAALPNQDRLQLSIGSEITTRGSTFTIRKFKEVPITVIDLVNFGTFSLEMIAYLWMAVDNGSNILVAGGTASGKTTVLNAIAMFIAPESKVVTLEDTREINLIHNNWIPAVTREVEEGSHGVEMFDLLRSALRQRPEYVLVGEVRGKEAHTLFQAMATGHITMSTFHADSAETIVKRLTKEPINVPLMLLDSLNVIALQRMVRVSGKGARRCVKIIEVTGVDFENEMLKANELFRWRPQDDFEFSGESSVFVKIMEKLNMNEDELGAEFARRRRILAGLQKRAMGEFQSLNKMLHDYRIDPGGTEEEYGI
ncbi:MAG: type II/IV secretion system ATPase subunit [Halobacteriota archaeon]